MKNQGLILALQRPKIYDHPIKIFEVVETHLSWVLLTGDYAYKIKKAVNLGFADFSTLAKRKKYLGLEYKLNQPLASELYCEVVPIYGCYEHPSFEKEGKPIEYALKMHQFNPENMALKLVEKRQLLFKHIDGLAKQLGEYHKKTQRKHQANMFGTPENIQELALETIDFLEKRRHKLIQPNVLANIRHWMETQLKILTPFFNQRKQDGFVCACHGDVHLNNIVIYNNEPLIFDCIEFNESFRHMDVMADLAFLSMDLQHKKNTSLAFRLVNQYLHITQDYNGLKVLNFYEVYRALVRAKVAVLSDDLNLCIEYLAFCLHTLNKPKPRLILMHGVSGSGKTFVANRLAEALGALVLHSDAERKVLHTKKPFTELYGTKANQATYQRLCELSKLALESGYNAIVDATFIQEDFRATFYAMAEALSLPYVVIDCQASKSTLIKRINQRAQTKEDASEATVEVLEKQLQLCEPFSEKEKNHALSLNTETLKEIEKIFKLMQAMPKQ